ncbi:hypothetical protein LSUE1_G007497, partial [Lachnellula suecica]
MLDLAIAVPALIGSLLSMLAAGFIIICYIILPHQPHFRHILILNLAIADFLNATNSTISGMYLVINKSIPPGIGCAFNGLVAQITVQVKMSDLSEKNFADQPLGKATDFAILSIALATLITLRQTTYEPPMSQAKKLFITFGIWLVPFITGSIGLLLHAYQPVSGNKCWIRADSPVLRYSLGHGWRLAIIFITIAIYIYLFVHVHNHFSSLRQIYNLNATTTGPVKHWSDEVEEVAYSPENSIHDYEEFEIWKYTRESFRGDDVEQAKISAKHPETVQFPTHPNDLDLVHDLPPRQPTSTLKYIKETIHPT